MKFSLKARDMEDSAKREIKVSKRKQAAGKLRRFYKSHFKKQEIERKINLRSGECDKCGRCCKILFRCPFLVELGESTSCRIYEWRFSQCRLYPIEPIDVTEIAGECTYKFGTDEIIKR